MVLTARAENHIRGVDDLDDTIARLVAYRDAGADALYAPGLTDLEQIAPVVAAVELPLNVLVLPGGPTVAELADVGVRRVSTGASWRAGAYYGALVEAASAAAERRSDAHRRRAPHVSSGGESARAFDEAPHSTACVWVTRATCLPPSSKRSVSTTIVRLPR